jgi:hypothetical protein
VGMLLDSKSLNRDRSRQLSDLAKFLRLAA